MSRYRLTPTPSQRVILAGHCAHARFVWNLAVEQQSWWRPGRGRPPGFSVQCAQLTEARAEHPWLAEGSVVVQQQALRDFAQAMAHFFAGTHGKPAWRKADRIFSCLSGDSGAIGERLGPIERPSRDSAASTRAMASSIPG